MINFDRGVGSLACPDCGILLRQIPEQLQCLGCKKTWPVIDGVPHFINEFPYWGEIPLEQMRNVNRLAAEGSWKTGLLDSAEASVRRGAEMILNLERANWQWLLDLPAESRVLDIGAGTGTTSHALAMHYREVVAVEPVLERVQFMQHRFAQERLDNIQIIRSSLRDLPFLPESFHLVAMNGVLEWVAEGLPGDPGQLQEDALKKMFRLLKPGGSLYIGIENRLCPEYCIGYLDPHCRLPFVTVLPRPLAHWYAKRKGRKEGYRNYLYSSRGYRRLLRRAGFTNIEVYVALPSYNHPRYFIPLEQNIYSYYSHNFNPLRSSLLRRIGHEVLLRSGLRKYMEDSFVIFARK